MALLLNNVQQDRSITAEQAIEALEDGIRQMASGDAIRRPRIDNLIPTGRADEFFSCSSMEGGCRRPGYYALRVKPDIISWPVTDGVRRRVTYNSRPGLYGGLVLLFSVDNAELLAVLNDGFIQHLRIGASAAIGVRCLTPDDAGSLAILGSGGMARSFAECFQAVRRIGDIRLYSPNREHAQECARYLTERGCGPVRLMDGAREAVRGAAIVATCTNAIEPVIQAAWLEPGMHIANVTSWELGAEVCARIDVAGLLLRRTAMSVQGFVDDDFGLRMNVMSYAAGQPHERTQIPTTSWEAQGIRGREDRYPNARYVDCINWATGEPYRRSSAAEITTLAHMSQGTLEGDAGPSAGIQGIQFATIAGRIYEEARRQGLGTELPQEMFLQDIPT